MKRMLLSELPQGCVFIPCGYKSKWIKEDSVLGRFNVFNCCLLSDNAIGRTFSGAMEVYAL